MDNILVYSDSLTWGIIPNTRKRLSFDERWPGVMENLLLEKGKSVRVIENCLNGRRTVWNDPFRPGRDGSQGLAQVIEMHSPLKLVILMLGINDFQCTHNISVALSGQGLVKLINIIRQAQVEPGMPIPEIMVVAPPHLKKARGVIAYKLEGAELRSQGLSAEYAIIAQAYQTLYFDAASVVETSAIDGIHLDKGQHAILGKVLANRVSATVLAK
ncbi:SGNH/GDSL hydrolase family protein [Shewanella surugensis]|uniref:SGNH/GDSL hydrolase family protein n=1 Tax=Shewanella surugensis TaxID=212020 RepID=A0ABT0LB40_9GAMM|nr:SGNH/GDSL hydrolase family protein [Shewanella surugensis]MCL1124924.1 SGNH/GDSL hydrolase family protein [Shewanella surugensis]